jgi:DNA/RNA-binding domain of Phe-tRNA-synthetase-like protein
MLSIQITDEWRKAFPGATIGLLEMSGIDNAKPCPELEQRKREVEARLRASFDGCSRKDFLSLPVIAAYDRYYARFRKTFHVLLQLESLVLKGKDLPRISPLVDANFLSEVETLVLTAGHDADLLVEPVRIDVSREDDTITQMNGEARQMYPGDMIMRDGEAVSCSVIYGQDNRSPISARTTRALYVAYAPQGVPVDAAEKHLAAIEESIRLCCPGAVAEQRRLVSA